jgi:hypothetical protein
MYVVSLALTGVLVVQYGKCLILVGAVLKRNFYVVSVELCRRSLSKLLHYE